MLTNTGVLFFNSLCPSRKRVHVSCVCIHAWFKRLVVIFIHFFYFIKKKDIYNRKPDVSCSVLANAKELMLKV